jgi:DNA-binding transcriptional regulator YhcF (GntR family)
MSGWFAMQRGVTSHPLLKGHPDRIAIWLWLIDNAAWKEVRHDVNGKMVIVPRGAVLVSQRRLAAEVGVTYEVVRRFLIRLREEGMITADTISGRTQITLSNYEKYQHPARSDNAAPTQRKRTKEEGYKDTSVSEETAVRKDPASLAFDDGVALLRRAGLSADRAHGLMGKWRRDHGDAALVAAIGRAAREGAIEPVAFIEGCLRRGGRIDDQTHFGAFGSIPEVSA